MLGSISFLRWATAKGVTAGANREGVNRSTSIWLRKTYTGMNDEPFRSRHANYFSDAATSRAICGRGAASAGKIVLELTAYRARAVVETGTGEADRG
jgi:hypothetical protein